MTTHSSTLAWKIPWTEKPGAGYSPWGPKESDTTERLHFHFHALKCCVSFCYTAVKQLYVYIYPLFFGFPSHLGHHRALGKVPCALQQILSYLFYTQYQYCGYSNPDLPICLTPPFFPQCLYVYFPCLCFYFCFANSFTCTFFQDSPYTC